MSIDDVLSLMQLPHLRVIDVACPRMMVAVMKWIAEGGRGILLLRLTRAPSRTIYPEDLRFEYGKGYVHGNLDADTVVITSGRGIYEALQAQETLLEQGQKIAVVDMPSFDAGLAGELTRSKKRLIFAEQNNGFLFASYMDEMYARGISWTPEQVRALSTRTDGRTRRHLHSGLYEELIEFCGIAAADIVKAVQA